MSQALGQPGHRKLPLRIGGSSVLGNGQTPSNYFLGQSCPIKAILRPVHSTQSCVISPRDRVRVSPPLFSLAKLLVLALVFVGNNKLGVGQFPDIPVAAKVSLLFELEPYLKA